MVEYPGIQWKDYELLDSGRGEKLERFGNTIMIRPEPKALWDKTMGEAEWRRLAHVCFRPGAGFGKAGKEDSGTWERLKAMDDQWYIRYPGMQQGLDLRLRLGLTAFKHVGVFPEQAPNWEFIYNRVRALADHSSGNRLASLDPTAEAVPPLTLPRVACVSEARASASEDCRAGILVHRIDKDTSGLLLVAKNDEAQLRLAKQFYEHSIDRRYQAVVWGDVKDDEGTIDANIDRDPNDRLRFRVSRDPDQGKHAVTHYRVLERFGFVTLVECRLETGRTHQIRVHMSSIGHPLFNDERYGGAEIRKGTIYAKYRQFIRNCFEICPRQALHAKTLGFEHPVTRKWLQFDSVIPADMSALLDKWRKYCGNMPAEEEEEQ